LVKVRRRLSSSREIIIAAIEAKGEGKIFDIVRIDKAHRTEPVWLPGIAVVKAVVGMWKIRACESVGDGSVI
jgi:hypothetical protein